MSPALLTKAEAEARLERLGARWMSDLDDFHSFWLTAWGFSFCVPLAGPSRGMYEDDLMEVEAEILASKP